MPSVGKSSAKRQQEKDVIRSVRSAQPRDRSIRYENERSALAEEGVIRLLYLEHELIKNPALPPREDFSSPALGDIYSALRQGLESGGHVSVDTLAASLTKDEMSLLVSILQKPEVLKRSEQSLRDYIDKIKDRKQVRGGGADLNELAKQLQKTKGYGR